MVHEEELYINNKRVDTDGKSKVALSLRSNLLQDISKIVSNHTYTVKLPDTTNNQDIISHADLVQRISDFAYSVHKARYLRNGVEIISNGRAVIVKTGESGIEMSVVWGLFPAFSAMVSGGITLPQLKTDDKILYQVPAVIDSYAEALEKEIFYAYYDPLIKKVVVNYEWHTSGRSQTYPEGGGGGHHGTGGIVSASSTSHYGGHGSFAGGGALGGLNNQHPCVKVSYVLRLVKELLGVEFEWTGEEKAYIDSLCIPLVKHEANELTYGDTFVGGMQSQYQLGRMTIGIDSQSAVFVETSGSVQELTANVTADTMFKVEAAWEFILPPGMEPTSVEWGDSGSYDVFLMTAGCYIKMTVGSDEYIIGENYMQRYRVPSGYRGLVKMEMSAEGKISLQNGQKVRFELCDISGGAAPGLALTSGSVEVTVIDKDDVPAGGYFPISSNLPDIKVIDFVKFLACITGTFPLQIADDEKVKFIPISDVWKNVDRAVDWTDKVVAPHPTNKPKGMEYNLSDWKQHNFYKWKEDDTVVGNYNGDLQIENEALDLERDVFTFPFAASDGNSIPLYEAGEQGTYTYKACKDRIMRLVEMDNGKAGLVFDINMQDILKRKYADLARTLQRVKLVHENIILSDAELKMFDESVPVYLSQYGRYFAVIEIKSEGTGVCDVTLLELVLR